MKKKVILITGANGQLGQCLQQVSKQYEKYDYIFTDINELDITQSKQIIDFVRRHEVNILINAAAYTAVDNAESDFDAANLLNHIAVGNLAKVAAKNRIRLFHVSTDYVFNGSKNTPYCTSDNAAPKNIYGRTKLKGEKLILATFEDAVIIRSSWLYSEFGNNFVKTMLKLGKEKSEIDVVFDQTGSPTYAMDLADFIMSIASNAISNQIIHYSNEGICSWYDFARKIMQYASLNCNINPVLSAEFQTPAPRPYYSVLDKTETKSLYKVKIPHWEDSLKKCVDNLMKD